MRGVDAPARSTLSRLAVNWPGAGRLAAFVVVVLLGTAIAAAASLEGIEESRAYLFAAAALLAVGLYASTAGIDDGGIREHWRIVLTAVTLGVLLKAALIAVVMYAIFGGEPRYLILGIAVAQIDPLAVAAIRGRSGMSPQASSILSAWASFDDPMTALLTTYAAAWFMTVQSGSQDPVAWGGGSLVVQTLLNGLLVAGCFLIWRFTRGHGDLPAQRSGPIPGFDRILQVATLVLALSLATWRFLMLGIAICGLFLRPKLGRIVGRTTEVAFWLAAFALGLVLVEGIRPIQGAVLGLAAFGAQLLVGWLVGRRLPRNDRVDLMLGHQNGITAIILALLLEPRFPGTVAIVAPAIITVNIVYTASNVVWQSRRRAESVPDPQPVPAETRP